MSFLFSPRDWTPCGGREQTLSEILKDPLIRALMRADAVDPADLEQDLRATAQAIEWRNAGAPSRSCTDIHAA